MNDIDQATRDLYQRVCRDPQNSRLLRAVKSASSDALRNRDFSIVLVPGIFYLDYPHTGADGAVLHELTRRLGVGCEIIPVDGTAGLDAGATRIVEWLLQRRSDRSFVLVSLSKGSAEVAVALARDPAAFHNVRAWLSVSGLPLGTEALELTLANPVRRALLALTCRLKGWRLDLIRELLRPRPDARVEIPPHMLAIHVHAFPLRQHLMDRRSRRLHRVLSSRGPNDGFAVLEDIAALPGYLYPVWGADHYLRGVDDLPQQLTRLLNTAISFDATHYYSYGSACE